MTLSRYQIFFILVLIFVSPFFIQKALWIANSKKTNGIMWFKGHSMELQSISSHAVIVFKVGRDSIVFNGGLEPNLKPGSLIPVRYQIDNPADAKVDSFRSLWARALVFAFLPFLAILVIFLTTIFVEPLIPKKVKITLRKPYLLVHG
ncbi:MAG TPA: DUF3592 domain-containing protein [Flavitalea sp.]|nr:DUF3592 domain-containing protein [Flavitalea sp.]